MNVLVISTVVSSKESQYLNILTLESELPKGSSNILRTGTWSLARKLPRISTSLRGLKSITLSPIERVSTWSLEGKSISIISSPKTSVQGKGGEFKEANYTVIVTTMSPHTS
ncbi:hypothetical protein Tco_0992215 [Tanacetum coccineum]|uniref:Uncharacterized protein n=1 Tax=Tanacetum coccineum TaxID=301880 RepID=A0ABQ5F1E8_9ASTR